MVRNDRAGLPPVVDVDPVHALVPEPCSHRSVLVVGGTRPGFRRRIQFLTELFAEHELIDDPLSERCVPVVPLVPDRRSQRRTLGEEITGTSRLGSSAIHDQEIVSAS